MYICVYFCTYVCIYVHMCVYMYIRVYGHICIYMCVNICILIYCMSPTAICYLSKINLSLHIVTVLQLEHPLMLGFIHVATSRESWNPKAPKASLNQNSDPLIKCYRISLCVGCGYLSVGIQLQKLQPGIMGFSLQ